MVFVWGLSANSPGDKRRDRRHVRSGDDNLSVDKVLVELGVGPVLVGGGDELVALLLDPLPDAELVLGGAEKVRLLLGVDAALEIGLASPTPARSCNWCNCSRVGMDSRRRGPKEPCP